MAYDARGAGHGSCPAPRSSGLLDLDPAALLRAERDLPLLRRRVDGRRQVLSERHVDDLVGERARHERQHARVVVAEVVAPAERVVDASAVETRNVALEVPGEAAEQVHLLL